MQSIKLIQFLVNTLESIPNHQGRESVLRIVTILFLTHLDTEPNELAQSIYHEESKLLRIVDPIVNCFESGNEMPRVRFCAQEALAVMTVVLDRHTVLESILESANKHMYDRFCDRLEVG